VQGPAGDQVLNAGVDSLLFLHPTHPLEVRADHMDSGTITVHLHADLGIRNRLSDSFFYIILHVIHCSYSAVFAVMPSAYRTLLGLTLTPKAALSYVINATGTPDIVAFTLTPQLGSFGLSD
jgi:hypothetical protein